MTSNFQTGIFIQFTVANFIPSQLSFIGLVLSEWKAQHKTNILSVYILSNLQGVFIFKVLTF
jgi:hypothetical protein